MLQSMGNKQTQMGASEIAKSSAPAVQCCTLKRNVVQQSTVQNSISVGATFAVSAWAAAAVQLKADDTMTGLCDKSISIATGACQRHRLVNTSSTAALCRIAGHLLQSSATNSVPKALVTRDHGTAGPMPQPRMHCLSPFSSISQLTKVPRLAGHILLHTFSAPITAYGSCATRWLTGASISAPKQRPGSGCL